MKKEYKVNPDGTITWVEEYTLKSKPIILELPEGMELSEDFMEYDDHKLFK